MQASTELVYTVYDVHGVTMKKPLPLHVKLGRYFLDSSLAVEESKEIDPCSHTIPLPMEFFPPMIFKS